MKKWSYLFGLALWGVLLFGQGTGGDDPPIPPPTVQGSSLPQTIASGVNYYTYIPLEDSTNQIRIDNMSQYPNDLMLIGEFDKGNRETRILQVEGEGALDLNRDDIKDFKHLYLISIQPFHAQTREPVLVFGMKTRHFATVTPSRRLELMPVENSMGKVFMVGITPDGNVHYPVYGYKFGEYDSERGVILRPNGMIFDPVKR